MTGHSAQVVIQNALISDVQLLVCSTAGLAILEQKSNLPDVVPLCPGQGKFHRSHLLMRRIKRK